MKYRNKIFFSFFFSGKVQSSAEPSVRLNEARCVPSTQPQAAKQMQSSITRPNLDTFFLIFFIKYTYTFMCAFHSATGSKTNAVKHNKA